MTDDDKALVECELCAKLLPDMEQSAARTAAQAGGVMQCRECGRVYDTSADRIEALSAENERLRDLHEAFRQDVSDRIEACRAAWPGSWAQFSDTLDRLIIAKPDPLVIEAREICARVCEGWIDIPKDRAAAYRAGAHDDEADFAYVYAALAKRGLEIREKE